MGISDKVILVADTADFDEKIELQSSHLEMTDKEQLERIMLSIREMGKEVILYHNPSDFSKNVTQHTNDFVVTLWSGKSSRNRRAIVPAICEGNNIKYMGGDPYSALICQDKSLSKCLINRFDLDAPQHVIYDKHFSPSNLNRITFPVVVKPSLEGGSIGISSSNLIHNSDEAVLFAEKLFEMFEQPILLEEFVHGAEVSICIAGNSKSIILIEAIEVAYSDKPDYLFDKLYSYEEKRHKDKTKFREHRNVTNRIPKEILENAKDLFLSLAGC